MIWAAFTIGMVVGACAGVVIMACIQINREEVSKT